MVVRKPPDQRAANRAQARSRSRQAPSLRARAVALLARREHSRAELRERLRPHAESDAELEATLDECEQRRWQSDDRFASTFVQGRASRFGAVRLRHELGARGVDHAHIEAAMAAVEGSEIDRAFAVWSRRFGAVPTDLKERARQARFLAQRGFSGEVVRQVWQRAAGSDGDRWVADDPD